MSSTTLPSAHAHDGLKCPVQGDRHAFCPSQPGDSRSVCPVLNAMANHGYLPRDGKKISIPTLISGLRECFGLSFILAAMLTVVGVWIVGHFWSLDLYDLGRHNRIEHDASLVHADTPEGEKYAPIEIQPELLAAMTSFTSRDIIGKDDFARIRLEREKTSPALSGVHSEIARGELALLWGIWETQVEEMDEKGYFGKEDSQSELEVESGIPSSWFLRMLSEEKLPDGWRPDHTQGLIATVKRSAELKARMKELGGGGA